MTTTLIRHPRIEFGASSELVSGSYETQANRKTFLDYRERDGNYIVRFTAVFAGATRVLKTL